MSEHTVSIPAADGYVLAGELFVPVAPNGGTVAINGAMGVARRFHHGLAARRTAPAA